MLARGEEREAFVEDGDENIERGFHLCSTLVGKGENNSAPIRTGCPLQIPAFFEKRDLPGDRRAGVPESTRQIALRGVRRQVNVEENPLQRHTQTSGFFEFAVGGVQTGVGRPGHLKYQVITKFIGRHLINTLSS